MAKSFWWPSTLSGQVLLVQNFMAKITGYKVTFGWSSPQLALATDIANTIIQAITVTDQCRVAMVGTTNWREQVLYGEPKGSPVSLAPVFPVIGQPTYNRGAVNMFFELRDQIVANAGYTEAIGMDLGLVGSEVPPPTPSDTAPVLKTVSASSNFVTITGSMQGMPVMRVEWKPQGQTYSSVAFVTNLPATIQIPKAQPENPENGQIRSIFVKNNGDFGSYSPNYDVTLA